jgi:hypothetical protein
MVQALCCNSEGSGSISDGVTGILQLIYLSSRNMALGSIQTLIEMSTRNHPREECGREVRLIASPPYVRRLPRQRESLGVS